MNAKKVLVVDDQRGLAKLMQTALEAQGYQVEAAFDGLAALEKARSFSPDAVVLDVMLPEENGYRVARTLKSESAETGGKAPKILLVTGRRLDDDESREDMFRRFSMVDGVLYKPFKLEALLEEVRSLIGSGSNLET